MAEPLFSIRNLTCSYTGNADEKVLHVSHLDIPKGRLVFLLGASGCGKSTLLETLGLMNDTVAAGSILFHPSEGDAPIDLPLLWRQRGQDLLNTIRKRHYSFIFQNTNLMENFTAYENVCLSGMIKEDVSQAAVLDGARRLMDKVKLHDTEVDLGTLALNLSGGQRQRLAFVRALNNQATVLFGDEPTGNLDEANANELFEIIRSGTGDGLSAIVVSHDIDLALKHADQIVVITKDPRKGYGEVHPGNVFSREQWAQTSEEQQQAFREHLRSFYHAANEQVVPGTYAPAKVDTSLRYRGLFLRKEGSVLFGKRWLNLGVLFLILYFTFLAIGFANGGLHYLDKVLNSAFVNWITIKIPMSKGTNQVEMDRLLNTIRDPELRRNYRIGQATLYSENSLFVWSFKDSAFRRIDSRTVDTGDQRLLMEEVLKPGNISRGRAYPGGFRNNDDIALIVKRQLLEELGYPEDAAQIYLEVSVVADSMDKRVSAKERVPIPIRAVVEELPGQYKAISTPYFIWALTRSVPSPLRLDDKLQNLWFHLPESGAVKPETAVERIAAFFEKHAEYAEYQPMVDASPDTLGFKPGYSVKVNFWGPLPSQADADRLAAMLTDDLRSVAGKLSLERHYHYAGSVKDRYENPSVDALSVYFEKNGLDRIRNFEDYLKAESARDADNPAQILMDVNQVKEKENFNFLSKVTLVISVLLVCFSALAIMLFIFNLLKSHLSRVSMNIGTFKALGLSDAEARRIYFTIILVFILSGIVSAFILSGISGTVVNALMKRNLVIDAEIDYFKLFDWKTALMIAVVLCSSLLTSWLTIRKLLNKTPGDLIYNR